MANAATNPIDVGDVEWAVGETTGTATLPDTIAPGEASTVDIPLSDVALGEHDYQLTIEAPNQGGLADDGTLVLVDHADFTPMTHQAITVDGTLDDLSGTHVIDLATDGEVKMDDYGGAADLSGDFAVTWDEDNLYLSAAVTDDTHTQEATGSGQIWSGDSIQFSVAAGTPGESSNWYEYGVALTSDGPRAHRWSATEGGVGTVNDADLAVIRTGTTTTYELALPWDSHLAPVSPDHGLLSFSLLVNDNDGAGRKGWIEWGGGIGGNPKDPALFNPMKLESAELS